MSKWRSWVALAAAYALALQIILTGVLATQMAAAPAADPFTICYSLGNGDGHKPNGPLAHQSCVICCVAPAGWLPSSPGEPVVQRFASAIDFHGVTEPARLVSRLHSPRSSQGPPQIA